MKIGILGGGQLGQMLARAAKPLGHTCTFLDPNPQACAAQEGSLISGAFDDMRNVDALLAQSDVVTYEFENLPLEAAQYAAQRAKLFPPVAALAAAQDRLHEKQLCRELGIPTAPFADATDTALTEAIEAVGFPAIVKTRRLGYDGKGQQMLRNEQDVVVAEELCRQQPCIVEGVVPFVREVSIIATRWADGEIVCYPLTENMHEQGILRVSRAPAQVPDPVAAQARQIVEGILSHFDYVGTLAVELFLLQDGMLLVNELAPRVHNSGHWTIEGCATSQFENHIRAITGMSPGSTELLGHAAMVNIIGTHPDLSAVETLEGVHVHLYGKSEQPMRKLGHVTVCHSDAARTEELLALVRQAVTARP